MVVVEVRHRTCGSRIAVGRGGRGEDEEEAGEAEGRSGRQERKERKRKERKRKAADIKPNNPHLAGGEKKQPSCIPYLHFWSMYTNRRMAFYGNGMYQR